MREPIELDGGTASLGVSIGIAEAWSRADDDALLITFRADRAMYRAKSAGKGQYAFRSLRVGLSPTPRRRGMRVSPCAGAGVGAVGVDDEAALAGAVGDRHAEGVEQREVGVGVAAGRREVVADDQRVRPGEQAHRLQLAEHLLASAGQADPRGRQHEPEERDGLQRLARRQELAGRRGGCPGAGRGG